LEHFEVWKRFGVIDLAGTAAKLADALTVLDEAWREELNHGPQ
jgi:hypothetical protein